MTTPLTWINDRLPTEADGDEQGYVIVSHATQRKWYIMYFRLVDCGQSWLPFTPPAAKPAPESVAPATPAPQPRRFFSIRRTILRDGDHIIDAVDYEGNAWWMRLDAQPHHPAFPPRDPEWQQLSPLPARELPTEPAF